MNAEAAMIARRRLAIFSTCVAFSSALGMIVAAEPPVAGELLRTGDAVVRFEPLRRDDERPSEQIRPHRELILDYREGGPSVSLVRERLETVPGTQTEYVETLVAAVGADSERLVAVVWTLSSFDIPPVEKRKTWKPGYYASREETLVWTASVHRFSLEDGMPLGRCEYADFDCRILKALPEIAEGPEPVVLDSGQAAKLLALFDETTPAGDSQP